MTSRSDLIISSDSESLSIFDRAFSQLAVQVPHTNIVRKFVIVAVKEKWIYSALETSINVSFYNTLDFQRVDSFGFIYNGVETYVNNFHSRKFAQDVFAFP